MNGGAPVSLARNSAAAESEGGPRRRNFVSLRGKQKFLLFACPVVSRGLCYGARPSVQFLPREARQSVRILLKKGSGRQSRQSKNAPLRNLLKCFCFPIFSVCPDEIGTLRSQFFNPALFPPKAERPKATY